MATKKHHYIYVPSTVLIVDDDQEIRNTLAESLMGSGYVVRCAANGQEALEWLRGHAREASMVLLDLTMPVMDGEAFLRAKENMPVLWGLPVVVISAESDDVGERIRREHVVRDCLPKPIPWLELHRLLGTLRLEEPIA